MHVLSLFEEFPEAIAAAEDGLDLGGWDLHQTYSGLVRYEGRPYLKLTLATSVTDALLSPCSLLPCVSQRNKIKFSLVRSD